MSEDRFVDGCDFCDIAKGEQPDTELVWRDSNWVAFFPLNPATPGHTLIIPRTHVNDLWKVDPVLGADLMNASIQMGRAIEDALKPAGMNLVTSSGRVAEQTVFHLHIHLVPRWPNDGFGDIWPPGHKYENVDLEISAEKIQDSFKSLGESSR